MLLQKTDKKILLDAALGRILADLVITNVQVVNVITGEIYPGDVFIKDGVIVHVEYNQVGKELNLAQEVFDGQGYYLTPGLIDAHVHIESSMLTPRNFAKAVIPWGTTTVITDPHEIANVFGEAGVKYMHDAALDLPMRQLINIPSCVPSVLDLENAGASFSAQEITNLSKLSNVIGLAEVMDYIGVINGDKRILEIIRAAQEAGLYIQGHAPFVLGRNLSAYKIGGPISCHESRSSQEGIEKLRAGMYVDARESSISKNVQAVWDGVKHVRYFDQLCLCTDDMESEDILKVGQMSQVVRQAIKAGMHPLDAYRSASYNIARESNLEDLGAIAPGFLADLLLIKDLNQVIPEVVFFEGKIVAKNQKLTVSITDKNFSIENKNSLSIKPLSATDFEIKVPIDLDKIVCNVMSYKTLDASLTELIEVELPVKAGKLDLSNHPHLKFVAVINRYPNNDNIAIHLVNNFGTSHGALASTVSHDSHNLTVVYDNPKNALLAVNEVIRIKGGMSAVAEGEILASLPLEVAGLMSKEDAKTVANQANLMKIANRKLGLTVIKNPLMRIVTLALPVIPEVKMSDLGLIDVNKREIIPLFKQI